MSNYDSLTAVQYGVGPIGGRIARTAAERGVEFVGALDIDPEKVGRDLGAVVGTDEEIGVSITDDKAAALGTNPDVVFHSTLSSLSAVKPQLEAAMAAGADVISTTESLIYPWWHDPELAADLDATANEHGVTCLGTGINPGFAMDTMPAVLTAVSHEVDHIRVTRVQDAATRREPLQAKVGAGTSPDIFESEVTTEGGHVGLPESVAMLAAAIGFDLEEVSETIDPVVADVPVETDYLSVDPGEVAGIHQVAHGTTASTEVIELDLQMYVGADEPRDEIQLTGTPDLEFVVNGGLHGDVATSGIVVNTVPSVQAADSGLVTMLDLPLPTYSR